LSVAQRSEFLPRSRRGGRPHGDPPAQPGDAGRSAVAPDPRRRRAPPDPRRRRAPPDPAVRHRHARRRCARPPARPPSPRSDAPPWRTARPFGAVAGAPGRLPTRHASCKSFQPLLYSCWCTRASPTV
jgi:hypothetical protein